MSLIEAVKLGDLSRIREILCVVDPNQEKKFGSKAIHWASSQNSLDYKGWEIVRELIQSGANVNEKNNSGYTALHIASGNGCDEIIKELLQGGANINEKDIAGMTPLHIASKRGSTDIVKILLQNGANIDEKDNDGGTALHWAFSFLKTAKELLAWGADYTIQDNQGYDGLYGWSEEDKKQLLEETTLEMKEPSED